MADGDLTFHIPRLQSIADGDAAGNLDSVVNYKPGDEAAMKKITVTDAAGSVLVSARINGNDLIVGRGAADLVLAGALDEAAAGDLWGIVAQAATVMSTTRREGQTVRQTIAQNVLRALNKPKFDS